MADAGANKPRGAFPTTRWGTILDVRGAPKQQKALLEELLEAYWQPLYLYARRKGLNEDEAADAVQGLCVQLLEREFLGELDPQRGRLRSFLRVAMNRYLSDGWQRANAKKRGGEFQLQSLDTEWAERAVAQSSEMDPDAAYELLWAQTIMQRALEDLEAEFRAGKWQGPFELVLAALSVSEHFTLEELSERFDMGLPRLKSFLYRARRRFRQLVEHRVGDTVAKPADQQEETAALSAHLTR